MTQLETIYRRSWRQLFAFKKRTPGLSNPLLKDRNTSVFRLGNDPDRLKEAWNATSTGGRNLKGAAVLKVSEVRLALLEIRSKEPPSRHAIIEKWPWLDNDQEMQKAQQLERAEKLAAASEIVKV